MVFQRVEELLLLVQVLQLVVEVEELRQVEGVRCRCQLLQQCIGQERGIGEVDTTLEETKFQKS